jgi:hypothetical protein
MALQMAGPHDLRKYNPERDMLWALHRYFRRALEQLGDGSDVTLAELFHANQIESSAEDVSGALRQFVKNIVCVLADPLLKETTDPAKKATELLDQFFNSSDEKYVRIRTLFCVLFMKGILCEFPLWCAMTRPTHPNDPLPSHDEIEAAAREFFDRIQA